MEALRSLFSVLYLFWPLTVLFGLRVFFRRERAFADRVRISITNVFLGWLVWAVCLAMLWLQVGKPVSLIPEPLDTILFFALGLVSGGISIVFWVQRWRKRRIRLEDAQTLTDLMAMTPEDFEAYIAALFEAYGHEAEVTGGNGDHGVDVWVTTDQDSRWIVQCKRYSGSVGEPVVRDLYGTLLHTEAQRAYLFTTGSITKQAYDWIEEKPIVLYDGESLVRLIRTTRNARAKKQL
jgi:restriction system protein